MIDVYYWTTPNGHKVTMFLEEAEIEYVLKPVNIGKGDQFDPDFLKISPNNKIPAIVDRKPAGGGKPITVFESGAILLYLAGKTGRFIPADLRGQVQCLEWLMWQMGGLGPMLGQNHHFSMYAPEKIPYAIERYTKETNRLYAVLDKRLAGRNFILGKQYSIADMASYPWINPDRQGQDINDFPNVKRWKAAIRARPATERAYARAKEVNPSAGGIRTEEERKILFGQDKSVVK
jgi:GST-like protein